MAKREIKAGATDQTIDIFVADSSVSTGAGLTTLVFNTSSLVCYYRKGATGTVTQLTLATQTVGGAHSDGGFVTLGANMPGCYRLDLSDTMVATAGMLTIMLSGATGMAPCPIEIEVVAVDKFDGVRMGLTALPNAAADAAGGLAISDAGGLDLDAIKTKTDLIPGTQDGQTFANATKLMASVLLGKATGLDTGSPVYRSMDDAANRVSATTDADGNRSAVTLNP